MKNYLVQAFEVQKDTVIPQFNKIMKEIKDRKELMSSPKENIYFINGLPRYPEGGEWKTSERVIQYGDRILPEVMDLLTEKGYDIIISEKPKSWFVSWEHFEEGRKGTITYEEVRGVTLEEKIKNILGYGKVLSEAQNWDKLKEVMHIIDYKKRYGRLSCEVKGILPTKVVNALTVLGYDVYVPDAEAWNPHTDICWSRAEEGKAGIIVEKYKNVE